MRTARRRARKPLGKVGGGCSLSANEVYPASQREHEDQVSEFESILPAWNRL